MAIEIKNLFKKYEAFGKKITALDDVSLSIDSGDFISVMGESGSGKSTLLNMLSGIGRPDSGSITIDGTEITRLTEDELAKLRRRKIGIIYQFYNLIPELNVIDNITLPMELDGVDIDYAEVDKIINEVGLSGRERDFPSALSGGQQQRVAIARAILQRPSLILADEPTGNLDEKNSEQIINLLKELNSVFKITVIAVTHSSIVAEQAKRLIRLNNGAVTEDKRL